MSNEGINKHFKRETKIMIAVALVPMAIVLFVVMVIYISGLLI